jgi:hypothetical protein
VETIADLQTQATGATPTPGETLISRLKVTMPTRTNKSAFSAKFLIIARRNAARESMPTSCVSTPMVALSGPWSALLPTLTQVRTPHQSRLSRIFSTELDGTPTSSSSHHSADHYEFVSISIATCNKLCEIMTPFHGDKKRPRINVTMCDTTFNWLFDTGAAITSNNANSFRQAFQNSKPRLITNGN